MRCHQINFWNVKFNTGIACVRIISIFRRINRLKCIWTSSTSSATGFNAIRILFGPNKIKMYHISREWVLQLRVISYNNKSALTWPTTRSHDKYPKICLPFSPPFHFIFVFNAPCYCLCQCLGTSQDHECTAVHTSQLNLSHKVSNKCWVTLAACYICLFSIRKPIYLGNISIACKISISRSPVCVWVWGISLEMFICHDVVVNHE